ncbi:hypothetical protein DFH08DRAFT_899608 [Mycena albidolilacea]|uniref:F-box domain-containing protein n=1 Tax=Mycena albidolilacea TaxID=1033008 RepID=A0AAD6Z6A7_9AGAR|nr:hypothetical protein DFH08DRAFT_899608 [Mycena albidolilacea]
MSVLPPELLDVIICEIDDTQTLKACSLVASTLRSSSQRILLDSLTVDVYNDTTICKLLTESPHVAEYVTRLNFRLRTLLPSSDRSFRQTLAPLQNVRECFLDGSGYTYGAPRSRTRIPPGVLDFLGRQQLRDLRLKFIKISVTVLLYFVKVIPTLYFDFVEIDNEADIASDPTVLSPFPRKSALTSLSCIGKDVGQFLARAQNISCVAALRHLSISSRDDDGWVGALIEAASRTLETVEFDCSRYPPPPALPRLPALQSVEFTFSGQLLPAARADIISRTATILQALAVPQASPALAKLVFKQKLFPNDGTSLDPVQYFPLTTMLDDALAAYPTAPRIHWILTKTNNDDTQFMHFADSVRSGMPQALSTGRLVLEAYLSPGVRGNEFRI